MTISSWALTTWALLIFSAAFFVVAILRIVEFEAAGIPKRQTKFLVPIHVLGSACFSVTIALLALDPDKKHSSATLVFFLAAILLLFPLQIYVGIKRKIRLKG